MTEDKIRIHLDEIRQSLHTAKCGFEMWWVLCGEETRPIYVKLMNVYNQCFRAFIGTTFDSAIIALYKVLESGNKTSNINKLLKILEKSSEFDSSELENYRTKLKKHSEIIKGIKVLRNNVVGHSSDKLLYEEVYKRADIKPNLVRQLINELIDIICDIYLKCYRTHYKALFESAAAEELEEMLQNLMLFHGLDST